MNRVLLKVVMLIIVGMMIKHITGGRSESEAPIGLITLHTVTSPWATRRG